MGLQDVDDRLRMWAEQTATAECDVNCRLAESETHWANSWEETENAAERICWGCDTHPWDREVLYVRQVWEAVREETIPIRSLRDAANLWSVPCPRGLELRSRGSRCLAGHFAYAILCFFRWMGEGNEAYGLLSLESAMDLAWLVQNSSCRGDWGFSPVEVAFNYERILTSVWHRHAGVPEYWIQPSEPAPNCPAYLRPPEPQELDRSTIAAQVMIVLCLVLVVYPAEIDRMDSIVDTYAPSCGILVFLTASDAPAEFRGYSLVDMRKAFPTMRPDPAPDDKGAPGIRADNHDSHNTIEKTLRAFEWAASLIQGMEPKPDIICRLDSDTMLFPQNLLRIAHCRNFAPDQPWALGHENYLHKHQDPGRVFLSGGNGICLSRGAVVKLVEHIHRGEVYESHHAGHWNAGVCVSAPGHWDDVVLGVCLAQFSIPVSRWGTDCLGRTMFWPLPLHDAIPIAGNRSRIQPSKVPARVTWFNAPDEEVRQDPRLSNYYHWLYRSWQHFSCTPREWISNYPVSLHPYRDRESALRTYRQVAQSHNLNGYIPTIWDLNLEACHDLIIC